MRNFRTFFDYMMLAVASVMMVACSDKDDVTPPPSPDETFTIEVSDLSSTEVTVTITPSDDSVLYYFDVISKVDLDDNFNGDTVALLNHMFNTFATMYNLSMEEVVERFASQGVESYFFDSISPDTEYVVYVVPVSSDGTALSEGTTYSFRSHAIARAEIDWEVTFGEILYDGLTFTIAPSDDTVPYYFTVRPQFSHGGAMSDEELLETVMAEDGMMLDYYAVTGEYESLYEFQEFILCSDTAYDLIIFAYSDGQALSDVKKVPFRSKTPQTAPADCTFELTCEFDEENTASISVTPSDEYLMYMWDVEDKSMVESYGGIEGYVDAYISNMIETYGAYEIDFARVMGADMLGGNIFTAGEYVIWAACVNGRGEVVSPIAVEEFAVEDEATEASASAEVAPLKQGVRKLSAREAKFDSAPMQYMARPMLYGKMGAMIR